MRHAGILRVSWGQLRVGLGLPANLVLDGVAYDPTAQVVGLIVEGHTDLPQVPDGKVPPVVDLDSLSPPPMLDTLERP